MDSCKYVHYELDDDEEEHKVMERKLSILPVVCTLFGLGERGCSSVSWERQLERLTEGFIMIGNLEFNIFSILLFPFHF